MLQCKWSMISGANQYRQKALIEFLSLASCVLKFWRYGMLRLISLMFSIDVLLL